MSRTHPRRARRHRDTLRDRAADGLTTLSEIPEVQRRELQKVEWLGYGDSGGGQDDAPAPRTAFEET